MKQWQTMCHIQTREVFKWNISKPINTYIYLYIFPGIRLPDVEKSINKYLVFPLIIFFLFTIIIKYNGIGTSQYTVRLTRSVVELRCTFSIWSLSRKMERRKSKDAPVEKVLLTTVKLN